MLIENGILLQFCIYRYPVTSYEKYHTCKTWYTIKYKKIECLLSNLQKYCVEVLRSRITGNSILYHKKK